MYAIRRYDADLLVTPVFGLTVVAHGDVDRQAQCPHRHQADHQPVTGGAKLTADLRVSGVCFTGGTGTARLINRTLSYNFV